MAGKFVRLGGISDMIHKPVNGVWRAVIEDIAHTDSYKALERFLYDEQRKAQIYPGFWNVYRALDFNPPQDTKVVILGQDPYHQPGQATGLAFSVPVGHRPLPHSLMNIFKAIKIDVNVTNTNGNLESWARQGVLLLNTILTVEHGKPLSHANKGWEEVTDSILYHLSCLQSPIVYLLWGEKAKTKKELIKGNSHQLILETSHPSPLSVHKGFLWCKHFSKANEFLYKNGKTPIDWRT